MTEEVINQHNNRCKCTVYLELILLYTHCLGSYSQYARDLYDPTDVLAEDFVCYSPSGQLVPLVN